MKHAAAAALHGLARARPARRRRHRPRISQYAIEHMLVLPLGALVAIAWVNLRPESYYVVSHAAAFVVNGIGMAFFLALIAKELVEATAPGGTLRSWRHSGMAVAAGAAAAIGGAVTFEWAARWVDEPMLGTAWPAVLGVDLALVYFVGRAVLGQRPALPFLLMLAITGNVLGLLAIASREEASYPLAAVAAVAGVVWLTRRMSHARVRSHWAYLAGPGLLCWLALYASGMPTALALLPIVPFMRHARHDEGLFEQSPARAHDTLSEFERTWKYPVQLVVFAFALINAGVQLQGLEHGTWAMPLAALIGKPAGVFLACGLGYLLGLRLPAGVSWRDLVIVSLLAALGFTFSLYFAAEVLPPGEFLRETKAGVFVTLAAIPLVFGLARLLRR